MGKESIKTHENLEVYQLAFSAAMKIFEISKKFPVEERYSLTDQICDFTHKFAATGTITLPSTTL
jgi:hypothetical protein